MSEHQTCDGVCRRDAIRIGALGATGLTLASYLRMAEAGEVDQERGKAGILIYLSGGPSHMDTFDLKPKGPRELRGEFQPISTNVPGIQICEHLPQLARQADKFAVLRGVSHGLAAHALGRMYLNSGNVPLPSLVFPSYAAVVAKEMTGQPDLPKAVAVPRPTHPAGYLGVAHSPLSTGTTPRKGVPFRVRGTSLSGGLTVSDVARRKELLDDLDDRFQELDGASDVLDGLDRFSAQAYDIIRSPRAREAFDISREPSSVADRFGEDPFGQSCLLAVRLVEAGVRFVTVELGGWDTHNDNFNRLKTGLLPKLDTGLAALFEQLNSRGLLDTTSVMVTGEFGRTPKINARGGRDHWPRAMSVLLAGGGIQGGQVIGASDEKGMGPAGDPITPDSVAASFYHSLGIDFRKEYHTNTGRPVMIVRNGQVIRSLFS